MNAKNGILNIDTKEHNILFTSDTHFNHTNIIKYCNRPFVDADEMNECLIENWNAVVDKDDVVFHLGDFAFGDPHKAAEIANRLNGKKYLVIGNHDWKLLANSQEFNDCFEMATPQLRIIINGTRVWMNHFPFLTFEGAWRGTDAAWNLFGHVHSGKHQTTGLDIVRLNVLLPTQYDVGVDNNNYTPVSWHKLSDIIHEQMMSLNLYRGNS